jgi:hypothetical protein
MSFPQQPFDLPSNTGVCDEQTTNRQWMQWFDRVHVIASASQQSGATADRPVKRLWVGRRYFDTTLNEPVWWDGSAWVTAAGGGGGGGVTDHGALTGLADDDHTQYHNNARGDARYSLLGHTHSSTAITDFSEAVDDRVSSLLVAGANVTLTYNDGANTLTIDAAGAPAVMAWVI